MTLSVTSHAASTAANTDLDLSNTAWYNTIRITNRSTTASPVELWARFDGTAATVAGDGCVIVSAASSRTFTNTSAPNETAAAFTGITPVHVISTSICPFAVEFN